MTSDINTAKRRRIDRYELLELIGEGGMGAVYRALDTRLGRTVALKTVITTHAGAALNQELRQRFMREALAASKVEHRNVVQVIDFGVTEDGTPYLVMEYLRGGDLATLLKDTPGALPIEQVADIMLNVCAALRACHQQGIVHRDLKPSNIFLAETDTGPEVKVLDFGVSKAPMAGDLTQEGQILGTPQYLSPEQVNGRVGPESDQYAIGVLLYVCLTKRLPFEEHQNLSLLKAIEVGRFPSPRVYRADIPEVLEAIILRAMSADSTQRFESVHALGQALWSFASARGQIEWRNYYFNTPAPGGPNQPTLPVTPPRTLQRTAVFPTPQGTPPGHTSAGPQMMVSTRMARTPQPAAEPIDDLPEASRMLHAPPAQGPGRVLLWVFAALTVAALVLAAVVWRGRAPVAPTENPRSTRDIVVPPPEPEHQVIAPPPRVQPPDSEPRLTKPDDERQAQPKRQDPRKKHVPRHSHDGPGPGIDQNGVGIPTN
jgi:eukaryotic-like serine/threonine-protein kinase